MLVFADPDEIRIILCKDNVLYCFFMLMTRCKKLKTPVTIIAGFAPALASLSKCASRHAQAIGTLSVNERMQAIAAMAYQVVCWTVVG